MTKTQKNTQAEMYVHVEAWKSSRQSQKIYCNQHGLTFTTFQYWARKHLKKYSKDESADTAPGFIPVRVHPDPGLTLKSIPNQLHFLLPNGVQVMCSETIHPEVLKTLLNPPPCLH